MSLDEESKNDKELAQKMETNTKQMQHEEARSDLEEKGRHSFSSSSSDTCSSDSDNEDFSASPGKLSIEIAEIQKDNLRKKEEYGEKGDIFSTDTVKDKHSEKKEKYDSHSSSSSSSDSDDDKHSSLSEKSCEVIYELDNKNSDRTKDTDVTISGVFVDETDMVRGKAEEVISEFHDAHEDYPCYPMLKENVELEFHDAISDDYPSVSKSGEATVMEFHTVKNENHSLASSQENVSKEEEALQKRATMSSSDSCSSSSSDDDIEIFKDVSVGHGNANKKQSSSSSEANMNGGKKKHKKEKKKKSKDKHKKDCKVMWKC